MTQEEQQTYLLINIILIILLKRCLKSELKNLITNESCTTLH